MKEASICNAEEPRSQENPGYVRYEKTQWLEQTQDKTTDNRYRNYHRDCFHNRVNENQRKRRDDNQANHPNQNNYGLC